MKTLNIKQVKIHVILNFPEFRVFVSKLSRRKYYLNELNIIFSKEPVVKESLFGSPAAFSSMKGFRSQKQAFLVQRDFLFDLFPIYCTICFKFYETNFSKSSGTNFGQQTLLSDVF